jgi:2,4-dienoyl-CoA reductase-like NADH-dependent reductase (Old Yellow Enzyme family)
MGMKSLFDEARSGQMISKNRFVRAAIGDRTADGTVTGDMLSIYERLAEGGVGTIINHRLYFGG